MALAFKQARTAIRSTAGTRRHVSHSVWSRKVSRRSIRPHASLESGLNPQLKASIDSVISSNKVVVFMKGTPSFPQCGFSNTVCQILRSMNVPFEGVNILENEALRSGMKVYSQWPTFPQVYVNGEFVGGADIMIGMYQSGELVELFERELNS